MPHSLEGGNIGEIANGGIRPVKGQKANGSGEKTWTGDENRNGKKGGRRQDWFVKKHKRRGLLQWTGTRVFALAGSKKMLGKRGAFSLGREGSCVKGGGGKILG